MFKRTFLGAIALCLSFNCSFVVAQDPTAILKKDIGTWDATIKMTMEGQEMEMTGVETNRMIGNNFVVSTFKGDFGGMPFEGHGTTGYDESKGKYVGTWVDNMTPAMSIMEGKMEEKTGNMVFMVDGYDAQTQQKTKAKHIVEYKDDGSRVMTMMMKMPDSDEWVTGMVITYTKRKTESPKADK